MTPDCYAENRLETSGTRGEVALKRITGNVSLDENHSASRALMALAARFDRKPNTQSAA